MSIGFKIRLALALVRFAKQMTAAWNKSEWAEAGKAGEEFKKELSSYDQVKKRNEREHGNAG